MFKQCRVGIVNCDDPHWQTVTQGHTCQLETYGFSEQADLRASDLKLVTGAGYLGIDFKGVRFIEYGSPDGFTR